MISDLTRIFVNHVYRPFVRVPADLFVGVVLTLASSAAVLHTAGPLRAAGGLVLILFLPGYALVSLLFPTTDGIPTPFSAVQLRRSGRPVGSTDGGHNITVDMLERLALSFGMSIALVPPVALALSFFGLGFDAFTIVKSLGTVTIVGLLFASHRRWQFQEGDRFRVPYRRWFEDLRRALLETDSTIDAVLNLGVVFAVVLALSTLAYPIVVPQTGGSYTEFSVLTESQSGQLVASGYPTEFVRGESGEVVLSVQNHEGTPTKYTVLVELQRFDRTSGTVSDRTRVGRYSTTLADGESWRRPVTITPQTTGENLRLTFYLYEGDPPAEPSTDTATEYLFIWVDVREPSQYSDDGHGVPDSSVETDDGVGTAENSR